jgi:HEAT repeat protein
VGLVAAAAWVAAPMLIERSRLRRVEGMPWGPEKTLLVEKLARSGSLRALPRILEWRIKYERTWTERSEWWERAYPWEKEYWRRSGSAAVPGLVSALRSATTYEERHSIVLALAEVGRPGRAAAPLLVAQLERGDRDARRDAAWALNLLGPGSEEAARALARALEDGESDVRSSAAFSLSRFDGVEASTIERLRELARGDPDRHVRSNSLIALDRLAAREVAEEALLGGLEDLEFNVFSDAVCLLLERTGNDSRALEACRRKLRGSDAAWRGRTAHLLANLGSKARALQPDVERLLEDPDEDVREAAREAILGIRGPGLAPLEEEA